MWWLHKKTNFPLTYLYLNLHWNIQRTILIQKKWIPELIFTTYWWMPVGSAKICRNSFLAMNLSIHGAVILAWDFFSVRWGKANSSPGIHDGNMILAQTRRKKRLGFISPDHAAPRFGLIYCQGQGEEQRGEIAATGRKEPRRQPGKRGENRERCDETRSGKRSGK